LQKNPQIKRFLLFPCLAILFLSGCRTGVFFDSPVTGLTYQITYKNKTITAQTEAGGIFHYKDGLTITFSVGSLVLGSAIGKPVITPLDIVPDAASEEDQRVVNICVLLQTLDQDGNLNNGIQITPDISVLVSAAGKINFNQTPNAFAADPNIKNLLATLNAASPVVFTDTDPRPRTLRSATAARDHFVRSTSERKIILTKSGALRGYAPNATTWQFLGIPYAKPPLGELRWKPPQAPESWEGVRDAIAWSDQAPQNPAYQASGEGGMSEDCLYLNVTAPKDAQKLPVMVWFHGGSFTILTSNSKQYNNAEALTAKGVVLVTVNHRLGPFGYLAHPLLVQDSTYGGSGNYGQMDLVAALQWVKTNIKGFGGDPENVTIFGQSGGGGKVVSLMNSPLAAGLFHKAICQSGSSAASPTATNDSVVADAEAIGIALFNRLGITTVEQARALPWTDIVQSDIAAGIPRETYRPTIDYYYMSKTYYNAIKDGIPSDVPLLVGVTSGDYPTLIAGIKDSMPFRNTYSKASQYVYVFSRVPSGWAAMNLLSGHGGELPYLFNYPPGFVTNYQFGLVLDPVTGAKPAIGDLNGNGVTGSAGDTADIFASAEYGATDVAVADTTMTIWTNFAKTGNPSTSDLSWPIYTSANDAYVELGSTPMAKTGLSTYSP
jgi:para-nitrobenzyl esterase